MKMSSSAVLLCVLLFVVNVNAMSIVDKDVAQDSEHSKYVSGFKNITGKTENKLENNLAQMHGSDVDACKGLCSGLEGVDCKENSSIKGKFQCICKDNSSTFDEVSRECKEDPCKIKCGNDEGVECTNDKGDEEVICTCKDKSKSYEEETKKCKDDSDDCSNNPCINGGTCYNVSNNTYMCSCIDPYMGMECEKNTGRLKAAVIVLSSVMVLILISCIIVFCKLKRTLSDE